MNARFARSERILGMGILEKVQSTHAIIVGVGGVGSFTTQLLAQLGVRSMTIIDFDVVQETNLSRQGLYSEKDVGIPKVKAAKKKLEKEFPGVKVKVIASMLDEDNASKLLKEGDVVFDCTDNFHTRKAINRACLKLKKPWIYAGAIEERIMSAVLNPTNACFECFATEPKVLEDCESFGVTNVACATAASMQVQGFLNMLREKNSKITTLVFLDLKDNVFSTQHITKKRGCICQMVK